MKPSAVRGTVGQHHNILVKETTARVPPKSGTVLETSWSSDDFLKIFEKRKNS